MVSWANMTEFQFQCHLYFQQINLAILNVLCKEYKSQKKGDVWHMRLEIMLEIFFAASELINSVYLSQEKEKRVFLLIP